MNFLTKLFKRSENIIVKRLYDILHVLENGGRISSFERSYFMNNGGVRLGLCSIVYFDLNISEHERMKLINILSDMYNIVERPLGKSWWGGGISTQEDIDVRIEFLKKCIKKYE